MNSLHAFIAERLTVEDRGYDTSCWVWQGRVNEKGYAKARHPALAPKEFRVHRVAYELAVGPIPTGMVTDHLCRVRACCNPQHLEIVTPRENTLRGNSPTAINARKTHCPRGHEYTPENTFHRPDGGGRACLACRPLLGIGSGGWKRIIVSTHCAKGHEWTPENTFIERKGTRRCRTCLKQNNIESKRRKRERKAAANRNGLAGVSRGGRQPSITHSHNNLPVSHSGQKG